MSTQPAPDVHYRAWDTCWFSRKDAKNAFIRGFIQRNFRHPHDIEVDQGVVVCPEDCSCSLPSPRGRS